MDLRGLWPLSVPRQATLAMWLPQEELLGGERERTAWGCSGERGKGPETVSG